MSALRDLRLDLRGALRPRGVVVDVGDGVARVAGLGEVGFEELVHFDGGAIGMAYDLAPELTGVVLLREAESVREGEGASAAGAAPSLPVGTELLGRVIDPLGRPLDDGPFPNGPLEPVYKDAPRLVTRAPVERPLHTGVLVVDAAVPIGRGQRQLLVGDRNVGKTALALDIVAAQRAGDVACVYVVIGQPITRVLSIRAALDAQGALANTVVVAADSADSAGLQVLAPYAGATVAEAFRAQGKDALVVYDDLTKHADAYRELALLLGRPPGREAFPGDIFYIHAELLERATALSPAAGGGSVTAFPIVETTDGDISSYIPTNLISITDGQLYLDATRFERNQRPPVDVGKSVSRVGGAAQSPLMRVAAKNLRIQMARFESLEALTRVGLDVDPATQQAVARGRVVRELLRQPRFAARDQAGEVFMLVGAASGKLDHLALPAVADVVAAAVTAARARLPELFATLDDGRVPDGDWRAALEQVLADHLPAAPAGAPVPPAKAPA